MRFSAVHVSVTGVVTVMLRAEMTDISFHSIVVLKFTLCANVFNDSTARSFFSQKINLNRSVTEFRFFRLTKFQYKFGLPLKKHRRNIRFVIDTRIKLLYFRKLFFLYSDGPLTGVPFIDDYISTTEQVSVF